jgi:hypothetical protein
MPKKGSKKVIKDIEEENEELTLSDENDKTTKFLTNQILNHQKLNYKKSINNFIKNNGLIILSC